MSSRGQPYKSLQELPTHIKLHIFSRNPHVTIDCHILYDYVSAVKAGLRFFFYCPDAMHLGWAEPKIGVPESCSNAVLLGRNGGIKKRANRGQKAEQTLLASSDGPSWVLVERIQEWRLGKHALFVMQRGSQVLTLSYISFRAERIELRLASKLYFFFC